MLLLIIEKMEFAYWIIFVQVAVEIAFSLNQFILFILIDLETDR